MSTCSYNMVMIPEPVGFLVYIQQEDVNLSLGDFCESCGLGVLDVMKVITSSSGFKPEPQDAIAFFLFEDGAKKFIAAMASELEV